MADRGVLVQDRQRVRRDGDVTVIADRVAGIGDQVHEHLQQLGRVAHGGAQFGVPLHGHRDAARHEVAGERDQVIQQHIRIDRDPSAVHAAGEGQHLTDHLRPALGRGLHRAEHLTALLVRLVLCEQLHRHQDRGEHVVEVVGDAAGERPEALEPLGPLPILLLASILGDIRVHGEHPGRLALVVDQQLPSDVHDDRPSVTGPL